jgi:hypothetical protein
MKDIKQTNQTPENETLQLQDDILDDVNGGVSFPRAVIPSGHGTSEFTGFSSDGQKFIPAEPHTILDEYYNVQRR